ncbi:MAG: hypothetical protein DMG01_23630, partial [Acidobacteria bacterium]
ERRRIVASGSSRSAQGDRPRGAHRDVPHDVAVQNDGLGVASRDVVSGRDAAAEVVEMFERMHAIWSRYLDDLADAELERRFEYTTYTGERYADAVHNVLTQLFSHSSYHRGQIALLLRRIGAEPALTDFVFWTRRRVDGS